ncbi:DUF4144 domain-containing protein [Vibrio fluvialis]|jgi:hypothetical protein|uniref:DUF4144 family protein n=1 Tax=Vibrio fluvialis TaxID=676 RepID=UPI00096BA7D9|nr:DUF4144 family protein [Vibrio fluvialis]EKO3384908.1 DUF4144 domain-containing protein [Vibrio fluvialis]EKO4003576.1 hypothetical protein [Vibrio fluvialis]ELH7948766.1 DUF4144 domain-containing protein [Vibrio fluvialis]ELV8694149.1 DUF4144 domain-containing protein [Vibrio fluvialis]MBL4261337.1 DUF4144 domain-containing protein [Vibrio fluvialis]
MVNWPALLKLDGDDELVYLASEVQFHQECDEMILGTGDHLIDCQGHSHHIRSAENRLTLVADDKCYSAEEVCQLIQAHEFAAAQVCVTKIYFPTVEQAVRAMAF